MDIVDALREWGLGPCNEAADEIERLRAERDALKLALEKCLPLLHEVILDNRDPRSPRYNECDRENKECLWCELAKTAIHEARGE